jgi:site-specific DNA-methyltransferase (adenine-specific)
MKDWCNRLHLADAIEALNALNPEAVQVDLVFADPPYNIGYSYDVYQDNLDDKAYLQWTEEWLRAASRVLKPTGAFWIAIGDEYVAETKKIADGLGLHLRSWVVWYYTFGVHCTQKFTRSHTHLLYFVKDRSKFTFNDGDIRVPSARQLVYNDGRADGRGRVPDNTWILRPQDAEGGFSPADDTWYFARIAGTFRERAGFHGCQLPERLLERVILSCTNPNEVVLDPFAGSGSTLLVAKKLGRKWVGYDVSEQYVAHASARISSARVGDPIVGPEDPLTSAPRTNFFRGNRQFERTDDARIMEAFTRASGGYSADRVVADPVLNAAFIEQCSVLAIPGRQRDWNLTLLQLRKSGKLAEIPTTKKPEISWEDMDPYEFASEMALAEMLRNGCPSLDFVLCDPPTAARFDDLARSLAPGFRPVEYRLAALRLRKDARLWRASSEQVRSPLDREPKRISLEAGELAQVRRLPGVYRLMPRVKNPTPIYVGETRDLFDRATRTWSAREAFHQFLPNSGKWELELFELAGVGQAERRGLQSLLIAQHQPRMNYRELASQSL